MTLDELLVVEVYFGHLGKSSLHVDFEVQRKEKPGEVVATGKYILVSVRQGEFTPTPVPEEVREKIAEYVEEN